MVLSFKPNHWHVQSYTRESEPRTQTPARSSSSSTSTSTTPTPTPTGHGNSGMGRGTSSWPPSFPFPPSTAPADVLRPCSQASQYQIVFFMDWGIRGTCGFVEFQHGEGGGYEIHKRGTASHLRRHTLTNRLRLRRLRRREAVAANLMRPDTTFYVAPPTDPPKSDWPRFGKPTGR